MYVKHEKSRKRQQKLAKQQARDTERDAQKRAVLYMLRVQDMLNSMGESDKENFRAGANGAVVTTCCAWFNCKVNISLIFIQRVSSNYLMKIWVGWMTCTRSWTLGEPTIQGIHLLCLAWACMNYLEVLTCHPRIPSQVCAKPLESLLGTFSVNTVDFRKAGRCGW